MKKMPDTKARMVRWGRMWPMLLMTKAVKTKSSDTIGKGVAVRTISVRRRGHSVKQSWWERWMITSLLVNALRGSGVYARWRWLVLRWETLFLTKYGYILRFTVFNESSNCFFYDVKCYNKTWQHGCKPIRLQRNIAEFQLFSCYFIRVLYCK